MTQTRIRRGGTSRLSQPRGPRGGRGKMRRKGRIGRLLDMVPMSADRMQKMVTAALVAVVALSLWVIASFFGIPGMVRDEIALAAGRAGFRVLKVEVHGTDHMDEGPVYDIAMQTDKSMMDVDLADIRARILKLSWVKDARVSRRLPHTIVVDVVERQPVAVWQHEGQLALVDVTGAVLDPVRADAMPNLPLVVGPHANLRTGQLTQLMESAPALKPVLEGATWVGNRRWDLRFQSGETLLLPEGDREAAAALVSFARMDGVNRLLGRGVVRFDMRDPEKFVLRLPKSGARDAKAADAKADDNSQEEKSGTARKGADSRVSAQDAVDA